MMLEEGAEHLTAGRFVVTARWITLSVLSAACGSGSRSGDVAPPDLVPDLQFDTAPPLTTGSSVEALVPTDGSFDVEPASNVRLLVLPPDTDLSAEQPFVRDRGSILSGSWSGDAATGIWSWDPGNELPRGNKIEVGTTVRGVLFTFTVREGVVRDVSPPIWTLPVYAFAWPSGRRALATPQGVFELQGNLLSVRSALYLRGPQPVGEQTLASVGGLFPLGECLRTLLDGSTLRASAPAGARIVDVDERGDVLLFVPRTTIPTSNEGFWRWRHDSVSPEHVARGLFSSGTALACMHDDGSTSVARKDGVNPPGLTWFGAGSLDGRSLAFDPEALAFDYDADAIGNGWLVWTTLEIDGGVFVYRLRWARTSRSAVATLPASFLIGEAPFHPPSVAIHVAQSGRATIDLRMRQENQWQHRLLEIDADGNLEDHGAYYAGPLVSGSLPSVSTFTTPRRGEFWALVQSADRKSLLLRRSKPGRGLDAPRIVYNMLSTAPDAFLGRQSLAVDDSGRAIVAVTGNYERAVVVIE